jgi:hypothetical protein
MADSITARSGWDKRVEVVKKLTDPNRKVNCQKCQKGAFEISPPILEKRAHHHNCRNHCETRSGFFRLTVRNAYRLLIRTTLHWTTTRAYF